MRILGLDIGENNRSSSSDPLETAQGVCTIRRKGLNKDLEEIKKCVRI